MSARVFITGINGVVGRRVVARLPRDGGLTMVGLVRNVTDVPTDLRVRSDLRLVEGDLCDPGTYRDALAGCDLVLHLAAVTGKARRTEYERVNVEGTRALLDAARAAGVRGFINVSSIAVAFRDQRFYWYAHSKRRAEALVAASGLAFTTVRPTMILGPGTALLAAFGKLATAPLIPVFGSGLMRVQPVFVDDVADRLGELVREGRCRGETIELGGAEVLTIAELLQAIRAAHGKPRGDVLRLPLRPIRAVLGALEPILLPLLPLTAGQLATFANDGVARPAAWLDDPRPRMRGLDAMLAPASPETVADADHAELLREAAALGRYLAGVAPSDYVQEKYASFHRLRGERASGAFDRAMLALATRSVLGARIADVYSARLCRGATLRRKLVLMLGLLECVTPSHRHFDAPPWRARAAAWCDLIARACAEVVVFVVAAPFLLLLQLVLLPWRAEKGAPA